MSFSAGMAAYKMAFQLSPIILTGGVANLIPGGMLPIISLTEGLNFTTGLLSGGSESLELDNFFANFEPLPGASLIKNQLGEYPFANQTVAANAIIADPLTVSLLMYCPARGVAGYGAKLATMMALKATLSQHTNSAIAEKADISKATAVKALDTVIASISATLRAGDKVTLVGFGTFTVATPSYFYTNCVLLDLVDVSSSQSKQPQMAWRWDFRQPLLTEAQAAQAQNSLMSKISGGTAVAGDPPPWSALSTTVGQPPSIASPLVVPAATGPAASLAAGTSVI